MTTTSNIAFEKTPNNYCITKSYNACRDDDSVIFLSKEGAEELFKQMANVLGYDELIKKQEQKDNQDD